MKIKKIYLCFIFVMCIALLASCGDKDVYADYTKVVFMLEGGECQNAKEKLTLAWEFGDYTELLIPDPNVMITDKSKKIVKYDHYIEGWYKTKEVDPNGNVTYKDKWDFTKDKITKDGITLYANWMPNVFYSYDIYYKDSQGNEHLIESIRCKEGETIDNCTTPDLLNLKLDGYTVMSFSDENGNPWDHSYTHPGGETDNRIKVYANVLEGKYELIYTTSEFIKAIGSGQNVILMNDLNFNGAKLSFETYSGNINGNGYTISNFELSYDFINGLKTSLDTSLKGNRYLYISIFYQLDNSLVNDITFNDFVVNIDIPQTYEGRNVQVRGIDIAGLATIVKNSTIENVSVSGTINIINCPIYKDNVINPVLHTDKVYISGTNVIENNNECNLIISE